MAKKQLTTSWFCSNCGNESSKWEGRCPACGEWNTMVEERIISSKTPKVAGKGTLRIQASGLATPQRISEIAPKQEARIKLPSGELNRVLGGGLVPGSMVLVGGEPGIGLSLIHI